MLHPEPPTRSVSSPPSHTRRTHLHPRKRLRMAGYLHSIRPLDAVSGTDIAAYLASRRRKRLRKRLLRQSHALPTRCHSLYPPPLRVRAGSASPLLFRCSEQCSSLLPCYPALQVDARHSFPRSNCLDLVQICS
eukprot:906301-Rhodomonas_salina.3